MAFRGYGDDAMKVAADQRQHAAQMAQIAASERASERSAAVSLAGQAESARQADMQLQARREEAQASRDFAASESEAQRAFAGEQAGMNRQAAASESEAQRAFAAGENALTRAERSDAADQELALRERQMTLNEQTYGRLNQQWQMEQEAQKERQNQENAATFAALRAASVSDQPVPPMFLNAINEAKGVAYGDPGSITGLFPIIDAKGNRLGFGAMEVGKDGQQIQKALDPSQVLPKMFSQMKPEQAEAFIEQITYGNRSAFDDKLTLEAKKFAQRLAVEKERTARQGDARNSPAALKILREQEETLAAEALSAQKKKQPFDPAKQKLLDTTRQKIASVTAGMGSEAPAAGEVPGLAAPAPAASGANAASLSGDMVTVTIDGQTKTVKDSPALRDWLKNKGISIR